MKLHKEYFGLIYEVEHPQDGKVLIQNPYFLFPGNNKKELQNKYEVYEESGVKEYRVIHPSECTLLVYILADIKFKSSKLLTIGEVAKPEAIEKFQ